MTPRWIWPRTTRQWLVSIGAALLLNLGGFVVASTASAATRDGGYLIDQAECVSYAKWAAHNDYGANRYTLAVRCWPKGRLSAAMAGQRRFPGFFHAWQAAYGTGDGCGGVFAVKGTHGRYFWYDVLVGFGCD